jgi:hypothetical protein
MTYTTPNGPIIQLGPAFFAQSTTPAEQVYFIAHEEAHAVLNLPDNNPDTNTAANPAAAIALSCAFGPGTQALP